MLVNSLAEIEKIELQSTKVKDAYKDNMQELQDVSLQQNALLGELTTIEDELDAMLPMFTGDTSTGGGKNNRFLKQVMVNPSMHEMKPTRE